jgi:hypothetical protein
MIINFLFDNFSESNEPTHNITPLKSKYSNHLETPLFHSFSMINWQTLEETLKINNLIESKHEIRFVKTSDILLNPNPNEKNIYLIPIAAQDFELMWPFYYIPTGVKELVDRNRCKILIFHYHGWPMISMGLETCSKMLYTAVIFSNIQKLDNILIMIDSGGNQTKEFQKHIDNIFNKTPDQNNIRYITPEIKNRKLIGIPKLIEANPWERVFINYFREDNFNYIENYLTNINKSHTFLFLNSSIRSHRFMMYKATEYLDIKKESIYSFRNFDTFANHQNEWYWINMDKSDNTEVKNFYEYLKLNPDANEVFLDNDKKYNDFMNTSNFMRAILSIDEINLANTWFSLVTETGFLSEKIFKLMYYGHPFIVIGNTGILKDIKELGYKTFDFLFDESYDQMPLGPEKILFIANQIKQYCGKEGHLRFLEKLPEIEKILRYNRELFISKDHYEFWANL